MENRIAFYITGLIGIFLILSRVYALNFEENFIEGNRSVLIVVGENASFSDRDSAELIRNNLTGNRTALVINRTNVSIVSDIDLDFEIDEIDDVDYDIISIGGPCVNELSADLLGVDFPTCGGEFSEETGITLGQYLLQAFSLEDFDDEDDDNETRDEENDDERGEDVIAVIIVGYSAQDTLNGVKMFVGNSSLNFTMEEIFVGGIRTGGVSGTVENGTDDNLSEEERPFSSSINARENDSENTSSELGDLSYDWRFFD